MIWFVDLCGFSNERMSLAELLELPDGLLEPDYVLGLLLAPGLLLPQSLLELPVALLDRAQLLEHGVDALGVLRLVAKSLKRLRLLCLDTLQVPNLLQKLSVS